MQQRAAEAEAADRAAAAAKLEAARDLMASVVAGVGPWPFCRHVVAMISCMQALQARQHGFVLEQGVSGHSASSQSRVCGHYTSVGIWAPRVLNPGGCRQCSPGRAQAPAAGAGGAAGPPDPGLPAAQGQAGAGERSSLLHDVGVPSQMLHETLDP